MSVLLWNQHNVGDAGFRSEQLFNVFYQTSPDSALFYVPIVAGCAAGIYESAAGVADAFPQSHSIEVHLSDRARFPFGYVYRYRADHIRGKV